MKTDYKILCKNIEEELTKKSFVRKEELAKKFKAKEKDVVKALDILNKRGKVSLAHHTVCPDWTEYTNKKGKRVLKKCWHPDTYASRIYNAALV